MKINGIITAMVTPLDPGGINKEATKQLVNHLITKGVHGLFVLGTNGEFYALSHKEKQDLVATVVKENAGRVPIFAGAGGISTTEVIDTANGFAALGVDAVSVITPYLIKLTDDEIYRHYLHVADNVSVPVILYNIPANTGLNITEAVFEKLVQHPNIIGIKDSSGDLENLKKYIKHNFRDDFAVLVGSDSKILDGLKLGADGAVAATSNVLTTTDLNIYNYYQEEELAKAQQAQLSIEEFRRILKFSTVPSVLKYALEVRGFSVGNPKRPVLPLAEEYKIEVRKVLEGYAEIEGFSL